MGAAEEPVDGLPEELPLEVPEGDVDAGERDEAPRAESVGLDLLMSDPLPDPLGVEGIGSDDEGPDPALDDLGHRSRVLAVVRLSVTDRPVVRGHLDEHEVALDVGAERVSEHVPLEWTRVGARLDARNLHHRVPPGWMGARQSPASGLTPRRSVSILEYTRRDETPDRLFGPDRRRSSGHHLHSHPVTMLGRWPRRRDLPEQ